MGGKKANTDARSAEELKSLGEGMARILEGATEALATLLGKDVSFRPSGVSVVEGPPAIQRGSDIVAEIAISGDVEGKCLLRLSSDDASRLVDLLMGGDGTKCGEVGPEQVDALSELVNQAAGSATSAAGTATGIHCAHAVQRVFALSPESAEAFNNSLDYPVVRLGWAMEIGDGMTLTLDQLVERRLSNGLTSRLAGGSENAGAEAAAADGGAGGVGPDELARILSDAQPEDDAHETPEEGQPRGIVTGAVKGGKSVVVQPHEFSDIQGGAPAAEPRKIDMLLDVPLHLTVELGRTKRLVKEILQLGPGSVLELDKLAGEAVDVLVNGRLLAKAEVVVIDENFGVRITEIVSRSDRLRELKQ